MRFPVALLPCPHLVFSVFYKCSHSVGCVVSSCGVNICIYLITNGGTPFLPFFFLASIFGRKYGKAVFHNL